MSVPAGLKIVDLCASVGVDARKMGRFLSEWERSGVVERVGEEWALTAEWAATLLPAISLIRDEAVPLGPDDDTGLEHCSPGPRKAAA